MSPPRRTDEPTPLNQRQLDILKLLTPLLHGQRTQVEAARLLDIPPHRFAAFSTKTRPAARPPSAMSSVDGPPTATSRSLSDAASGSNRLTTFRNDRSLNKSESPA